MALIIRFYSNNLLILLNTHCSNHRTQQLERKILATYLTTVKMAEGEVGMTYNHTRCESTLC